MSWWEAITSSEWYVLYVWAFELGVVLALAAYWKRGDQRG